VEALAKRFPTSPLAADVAAGSTGIFGPTFGLGMISAVAIPAFLNYTNAARASETDLATERLKVLAIQYARANGEYPRGTTERTPSVGSCSQPDGTFADDPTRWEPPAWKALGFAMPGPFRHQYIYEGQADHFVASIVMDLDCDGLESVARVRGTLDANGTPVVEILPRVGKD
jgi:type II secretory pathway pseudopilin PulG